jgi:hypothetical protein
MKTKRQRDSRDKESSEELFELKYCERCGGLWLRPVRGSQIYCVACAQAMAELPPAPARVERASVPEDEKFEFDAAGGVA